MPSQPVMTSIGVCLPALACMSAQVEPTNFTFGETYNLGYSMPLADTVLSLHPLPACTTFTAHWHPNADETSIVIHGGKCD